MSRRISLDPVSVEDLTAGLRRLGDSSIGRTKRQERRIATELTVT
jgi:hypothetical protein